MPKRRAIAQREMSQSTSGTLEGGHQAFYKLLRATSQLNWRLPNLPEALSTKDWLQDKFISSRVPRVAKSTNENKGEIKFPLVRV
jgi:hypothetical protein